MISVFYAKQSILLITLLLLACQVFREEKGQGEDILQVYGSEEMISLATGYRKPLDAAPAVATVITSEDIERMGATTLAEVLETVPGLHVSTARAVTSLPIIRGIVAETDTGVLVLFNGIPIGRSLTGSFTAFQDVMTENIERVEVIRGPGSALYGADALAGVINVITKTASGINGTEIGVRAGSLDTYDGWLLHGRQWHSFNIALALLGRTTNGYDRTITADTQTQFDALFGTEASLAPGPLNTDRNSGEASLNISSGPWTMRANYRGRSTGTGTGFINALDPKGRFQSERVTAEVVYHDVISRNLEINGTLSYLYAPSFTRLTLLPPGAFGVFPAGVRNNLELTEQQALTEFSALYSAGNHILRAGAGFYYQSLEDVKDKRNYLIDPAGRLIPTGVFTSTDELGVPAAQPESDRTVYYGFIQDEWSFARDWNITTGLRFDHFSDVGTAISPRLALIWNATLNFTAKLLYGHAFRPSSFLEQFSRNNLVAQGDPNLDPEIMDTVELSINYRNPNFRSTFSLYRYWYNNRIGVVANPIAPTVLVFENLGEQKGYGFEWEVNWNPTADLQLKGNYAYQKSVDDNTHQDVGIAPKHKVYAEADWRFMPNWHLNASVDAVLDRDRMPGDPRSDIDDYTVVNVFVQQRDIADHFDISLGIRNLFDVDAREPSTSPQSLPFDIPLPGRMIFGEIRTRF